RQAGILGQRCAGAETPAKKPQAPLKSQHGWNRKAASPMGKGGAAFPRLIFFAVGAPFQKRGSAGSPTGRWGRTGNRPAGTAPLPAAQAAAKWSGRSE